MFRRKLLPALLIPLLLMLSRFTVHANTLIPGDILISDGYTHTVIEYSPGGKVIQTINVPLIDGFYGTNYNRGLVVDSSGNIQVCNGSLTPSIATYMPLTNTWTSQTTSAWGIVGTAYAGAIATYQNYVYAPNTADNSTELIRFDMAQKTAQRFAGGTAYDRVILGQDGLLYASNANGSSANTSIDIYDPKSLHFLRNITLSQTVISASAGIVTGLAVSAHGDLFVTSSNHGDIFHLDRNGNLINQGSAHLVGFTTDLVLAPNGQLLIGADGRRVVETDQLFSQFTTVISGGGNDSTFIAAVPVSVPEPSAALLLTAGTVGAFFWRRRSQK